VLLEPTHWRLWDRGRADGKPHWSAAKWDGISNCSTTQREAFKSLVSISAADLRPGSFSK